MKRFLTIFLFTVCTFSLSNAQTDGSKRKKAQSVVTTTPTKPVSVNNRKQNNNNKNSNRIVQTNRQQISKKTFTVSGVSFNMMVVKAGTFIMGAVPEKGNSWKNEKNAHQVTITKNFYIGETEVTQELWKAVMGDNPSNFKGDNKPVESVSWNDCQKFIHNLSSITGKNFRLPTEAEWEFAARGGERNNNYQYSGSNILEEVAWFNGNSGDETHNVATKKPNGLGIYDMSGNVYEWCSDWYEYYSTSNQTNPTGAMSGSRRVYRGGCWFNAGGGCSTSHRGYNKPDFSGIGLGLRLALNM